MKAIGPTLNALARNSARIFTTKIDKSRAYRLAEEMGLAQDTAVAERILGIVGGEHTREGVGRTIGDLFFKGILLEQFTRYNRVYGFAASKYFLRGHMKYLAKGKAGSKANQYRAEMFELGLNPEDMLRLAKAGETRIVNARINQASNRFVNEVVMAPRATIRPMWMNNPNLQLIGQLKSFQVTFGNTVVKRLLRKLYGNDWRQAGVHAVKATTVVAMMMLMADQVQMFRHFLRYGDLDTFPFDDPGSRLFTALDRIGLLGSTQVAVDMAESQRYGQGALAVLLGPAASQFANLMPAAGSAAEGDFKAIKRWAEKSVPIIGSNPQLREAVFGDD